MLLSVYAFPSLNNFKVYQFLGARMIAYGYDLKLCNINSKAYIAGEMARREAIKKCREEVLEQMDRSLRNNKKVLLLQ